MWKRILLLLAVAAVFAPPAKPKGVRLPFDLTLKGVSKTMTGEKFKFTALGTLEWDPTTGEVDFTATTSTPMTFSGSGIMAANEKGVAYASTSFVFGDTGVGDPIGAAVFAGKLKKKSEMLVGKFLSGAPARLGDPPDGFVYTKGKIKAKLRIE